MKENSHFIAPFVTQFLQAEWLSSVRFKYKPGIDHDVTCYKFIGGKFVFKIKSFTRFAL